VSFSRKTQKYMHVSPPKEPRELKMCGDGPGGIKTFEEQVPMPLGGRVQCIDKCIAHIVAALNAGGIETVASCCGHGKMDGLLAKSYKALEADGCTQDLADEILSFKYPPKESS
jgi:hypothetical protein